MNYYCGIKNSKRKKKNGGKTAAKNSVHDAAIYYRDLKFSIIFR